MKYSDLQYRVLFQQAYEELIIDRLNVALKSWSEGLDEELDRIEKEVNDERQE